MDYHRERTQGICEDVDNGIIRLTLDQACQVVEDGDVDWPTVAPSPDKYASESSTTQGRVTVLELARKAILARRVKKKQALRQGLVR